jgi:hypothetical protein
MTSSTAALGPNPIVDFDGTMAYLPVDWAALRRQLRVASMSELWERSDDAAWTAVAAAEVAATALARPIAATVQALEASQGFVVVTDNDESAVAAFLGVHPVLADKAVAVLGRRFHGGPKRDADVFARALRTAVDLLPAGDEVVYCGDQDYELAFARAMGARPVRVLLSGQFEVQLGMVGASAVAR